MSANILQNSEMLFFWEATFDQLPMQNLDAQILRELCGKLRAKSANLRRVLEVTPRCHVFCFQSLQLKHALFFIFNLNFHLNLSISAQAGLLKDWSHRRIHSLEGIRSQWLFWCLGGVACPQRYVGF